MIIRRCALACCLLGMLGTDLAYAGGGPLGIDRKLDLDDHGIWKRSNQVGLQRLMIASELAGALWEGSDTRLGKTFWQSIDATLAGQAGYFVLNGAFRRLRPSQTDSPNQWFKHGGHSFPSGEVTTITNIVTPFVLEYRQEHPGIYALELLSLYDAEARMKVQGHWQSDVLAGWALGTAAGYYAHSRQMPFTVAVMPHAITVGWRRLF